MDIWIFSSLVLVSIFLLGLLFYFLTNLQEFLLYSDYKYHVRLGCYQYIFQFYHLCIYFAYKYSHWASFNFRANMLERGMGPISLCFSSFKNFELKDHKTQLVFEIHWWQHELLLKFHDLFVSLTLRDSLFLKTLLWNLWDILIFFQQILFLLK